MQNLWNDLMTESDKDCVYAALQTIAVAREAAAEREDRAAARRAMFWRWLYANEPCLAIGITAGLLPRI